MKKLVIVESPAKSKTINGYLGNDYKVVSSMGHIRDLATSGKYGLGVDVEQNFEPNYIPLKGKKKLITDLKKDVKNSDKVILATDPDREGEAISWHLKEALEIDDEAYERVTFHEITKDVVLNAIASPRKIDNSLVKSQETRRILDRIIGFRLSKLMQSKTGGKSAGRVQSVALKLIVDREREIEAFIPVEYWSILAKFDEIEADLVKHNNKKIEINNESEAQDILKALSNDFKIEDVNKKDVKKNSKPAFKTTTLQRMAASVLNFAPSKTMRIAQKLYEGISLDNETVGLITYMRTDSERLSPVFVGETKGFIEKTYGKEYVGSVKVSKKKENMQDAHEGIRPTSIYRNPDGIKKHLTSDEYKLYRLIYFRALASLMASASTVSTTVILDNNNYQFNINGSILSFDGYLKIYREYEDNKDIILPENVLNVGSILNADEIIPEQHFTKHPPRFNEASLIKEMESLGIGRPSTYAPIVGTLKERGYVTIENKNFIPTEVGVETTDRLQDYFSEIINVEYTAKMETELDEIAIDKVNNIDILKEFYGDFEPLVQKAFSEMEKKEPEKTGEVCPECGSELVVRNGRYGKFVACSNYPECKYIKKNEAKPEKVADCPKCGGEIVERHTRKGKVFYGCSNYPKCDFATWYKPTGEICPECKNLLIEKKDEIVCNACDYKK